MTSKNFIAFTLALFLFSACSDSDYPIVYEYEKTEQVGSSIVTIDSQAALTFVDQFAGLDADLCDIFEDLIVDPIFQSVTLISESELEIRFITPDGEEMTVTESYSEGDLYLVDEFSLELNADNTITHNICGEFNLAPSIPDFDTFADFCSDMVPQTFITNKFVTGDYTLGDTLGVCILKRTYRKQ